MTTELIGPPSNDLPTRLAQVRATIAGFLMYDPVTDTYIARRSFPDGEGFCSRCLMPLTQCNCKNRGGV